MSDDDTERMIADALADGKLTDADADAIRDFADFLRHTGLPAGDYPSPDDKTPIQRMIAAGRPDLIEYALGATEGEAAFWNSLDDEAAFLNTAGDPPYDVWDVGALVVRHWINDSPPRVLDLGCGQGRLTNHLAQQLPRWTWDGVDISRKMLDWAVLDANQRGLSNVHYFRGNGRTLPPGLGGRNYDLVYSVAMFQHIPYEAMWGYIREVEKRLKPGGVFTFTIAVGDDDQFLNHQVPDTGAFADDLMQMFNTVTVDVPDARGWTWVTVDKEA